MGTFAYLTAEEMADADRAAIEDFGIDVLVLMENAGARVAELVTLMLGGDVQGRKVTCLAGKGNNGGDAIVAARRLFGRGADVSVVLSVERDDLREAPASQMSALEKAGVKSRRKDLQGSDLIVDGLLGYNLKGDPKGRSATLIRQANDSQVPIVAVDLPSGLDATTGVPGSPCIEAKATVTFGFLKKGFLSKDARKYLGELYLGDISFPGELGQRYGQDSGVFDGGPLIRARLP